MNPTLGLLLPMLFGQPALPCGPGVGPCAPGVPPMYLQQRLMPYPQVCPPSGPPAPVLAMKAILPEGATISALPGLPGSKSYASGSVFGFRPGYVYKLKIDNIPGHPNDALYPSLEVRGSIVPRPGMRYMEYTAPLHFSKADLDRVLNGAVITKVIYLEDPSKAIPNESKPDMPIEVETLSEGDAIDEALSNGRVVAVLRLGDRMPDQGELAAFSLAGTVLLPGEQKLGMPAFPPMLPSSPVPLYDPLLGPKPLTEECFVNGGDGKSRLGVGPNGQIGGLDPTDVVAEYTLGSKRKVGTSNVVCICVPRFVTRRSDVVASGFQALLVPGAANQVTHRSVFSQRAASEVAVAREKTLGLSGKDRPSAAVALTGLHAFGSRTRLEVTYTVSGLRAIGTVAEPDELSNFPGDLTVVKSVEPKGPYKIGDELTITIRYANNTRQPVSDLIVSDSLSGRLEYVVGSAAADRPSNVTTTDNEAGSVAIRFELLGAIQPGTKGVAVFKVRIR